MEDVLYPSGYVKPTDGVKRQPREETGLLLSPHYLLPYFSLFTALHTIEAADPSVNHYTD